MENKQLKNRIQHDMEFNETMRELEDAKQAKDDFMANISHEIRTPLNSIIGIGSELLDAKVDDTTKEQLYYSCGQESDVFGIRYPGFFRT